MRYKVDDQIFENIDLAIDYCIEDNFHEDDGYFEEWVNDHWGYISIDGNDYYAFDILDNAGNLDDVRYMFMANMNDEDRENTEAELRHAHVGDEIYCQNYTIEVIGDEETRDIDGDDAIEMTRRFIAEQKLIKDEAEEEEKKHETDFMELFQVIK